MSADNYTTSNSLLDELEPLEAVMLLVEVVIFIPTVFGNVLILISVNNFNWLQTPLNILIENLAVCDVLIATLLIPLDVLGTLFGLNRFRIVCLLQLTILMTLLLVSIFTILAISVERYISVAYPWQHRMMKKYRYVHVFNFLSWTISISLSCSPLFGWNKLIDNVSRCHLLEVWPDALRFAANTVIILISVANFVLFAIVVKIGLKRLPQSDGSEETSRMRRNLAKTYLLVAISAMFIICWAPHCVVTFANLFFDSEDLKLAQGWTLLLGLFNSALNWLIYGLKNEKMRRAFKILLCGQQRPSSTSVVELDSR